VAAAAKLHVPLTVALLGRADDARAQLRRALEEFGAQVVFEADPAGLAPETVSASGAQVVIVNLASGVEDDIDPLQPLFDDQNVNVVFNEADVSSQLAGWDLARWARHLAAKVTGQGQTIPPPPPGAELLPLRNFMPVPGAPPTPAQQTPERPIEEFMIEAEDRVDDVPSDHLPFASARRAPIEDEPVGDFSIDVSEVEGALAQIGPVPSVEQRAVPEPEVPEIVVHEDEAAEFDAGLDLAALDAALELDAAPAPTASGKSEAELLDEALAGVTLDFDGEAEPADDDNVRIESVSFSADNLDLDPVDGHLLDDDVAALAAQLDAMESGAPRGEVRDLEFIDFSDAPSSTEPTAKAAPMPAPAAAPIAAAAAPRKPSFGALDLAPMDGDHPETAPAKPAPAKPSYDFSSLTLSLEPDGDEVSPAPVPPPAAVAPSKPRPDFGNLGLSLEPTEDELQAAPTASPAAIAPVEAPDVPSFDALFAAMELAPTAKAAATPVAPGMIPRVIVLGASIGGPDALRSFLGGIPEGFPALFVLAQHLESGFFERLAQQLQKASKLPVRVPEPGQRALAGEVLVVPAKQRLRIERSGEISAIDHAAPPKYTPSIDDVMRDAADRFGAQATAIIFSGMAGDAIEGAVYLTTQGGEVWAQDPASCVVSSMVDGARARGVVEFVGSPRELAERCVARYGKA
jgi:hypothetical protein